MRHSSFFHRCSSNVTLVPASFVALRSFQTHYGPTMRSHAEMVAKFAGGDDDGASSSNNKKRCADGAAFAETALPLLERVEDRLALWKRQKWEFRTPALLPTEEKVAATALLRKLQATSEQFGAKRRRMLQDGEFAAQMLNVSLNELRLKPRAWLQKRVAGLRMQGRSDDAKALREAWLRMEELGGPDYNLLERLVFIYGLGKMGTFDGTFSNTIVASSSSSKGKNETSSSSASSSLELDTSDPFSELLSLVLTNIPDIHILYGFLGWDEGTPFTSTHASYSPCVGEYAARCLQYQFPNGVLDSAYSRNGVSNGGNINHSNAGDASGSDLLFSDNSNRVYLLRNGATSNGGGSQLSMMMEYALWHGPTLTLISTAHPNRYLRQNQLPHKKQLEGMCRRSAFVLGYSMDDVRVRTLLLPPSALDRRSLLRLHAALDPSLSIAQPADLRNNKVVGEEAAVAAPYVDKAIVSRIPPEFRGWISLYRSELAEQDEDYATISETKPGEEWCKL